MPGPKATALQLSPTQRDVRQRPQRQQTADRRRVRRASILLALAANPGVDAGAHRLGLTRVTVRLWRDRWRAATEDLRRAEEDLTPARSQRSLEPSLDDAPRPGTPATFSPERIVQVVAVASEPPEESDRPIDHRTGRELADEVQRRGIVPTISPRSVGRLLKRGRVAAAPEPLPAQCRPGGPRGLSPASGHGLRAV